jgi:hypothetical protein
MSHSLTRSLSQSLSYHFVVDFRLWIESFDVFYLLKNKTQLISMQCAFSRFNFEIQMKKHFIFSKKKKENIKRQSNKRWVSEKKTKIFIYWIIEWMKEFSVSLFIRYIDLHPKSLFVLVCVCLCLISVHVVCLLTIESSGFSTHSGKCFSNITRS